MVKPPRSGRTRFEFEYRVSGDGWASARVADGDHEATATASYLSDALRVLLEAVAVVTEDDSESRCSWDEEPGEYRWVFRRSGELLSVHVLWFEEGARPPDSDGTIVFASEQPVLRVARSVLAGAQEVLDGLGPEGYLERWNKHPFPVDAIGRLRRAIPASRTHAT